jgi:DNA-binding MarR family transcriptional regulator
MVPYYRTMISIRELPRFEVLEEDARRIPTLDPSTLLAFLSVLIVASDVERRMDAHFARYGLSQGRFVVLMLLNRRKDGHSTPADLADEAGVTRATMTGLLDGLEAENLVDRTHRKDDRRMIDVRITRKGQSLLERILPDHYARIGDLMSNLTKAEKKTLTELLGKVRERFSPST